MIERFIICFISYMKTSYLGENKLKKRVLILITAFFISVSFLGCKILDENIYSENTNEIDENVPVKEEKDIIAEEDILLEPRISNINLIAAGDIMFHSPQFRAAYNSESESYDFSSVFKYVKKHIEEADIALANFETVTAGEEVKFSGFPRFNTPKEALLAIKEAGFHILSTANNHSLDQGKKGLIGTIEAMEEYGLKNIGTYSQPNENILIEEVKGIKLGFLSYTYGLNGLDSLLTPEELSYMINLIDEEKIGEDIKKTKDMGVDLTVIFIHWGHEYHREPSEYQMELGEKLVDWGGDIILGSHPHVIQKSQIIEKDGKDKFIIYSMGNFLSNQRYETLGNSYTEDGILINLNIEKNWDSGDTIIKDIEYIPTWVNKYRENEKVYYEILPIKDAIEREIEVKKIDSMEERLKKSYTDTLGKMKGD